MAATSVRPSAAHTKTGHLPIPQARYIPQTPSSGAAATPLSHSDPTHSTRHAPAWAPPLQPCLSLPPPSHGAWTSWRWARRRLTHTHPPRTGKPVGQRRPPRSCHPGHRHDRRYRRRGHTQGRPVERPRQRWPPGGHGGLAPPLDDACDAPRQTWTYREKPLGEEGSRKEEGTGRRGRDEGGGGGKGGRTATQRKRDQQQGWRVWRGRWAARAGGQVGGSTGDEAGGQGWERGCLWCGGASAEGPPSKTAERGGKAGAGEREAGRAGRADRCADGQTAGPAGGRMSGRAGGRADGRVGGWAGGWGAGEGRPERGTAARQGPGTHARAGVARRPPPASPPTLATPAARQAALGPPRPGCRSEGGWGGCGVEVGGAAAQLGGVPGGAGCGCRGFAWGGGEASGSGGAQIWALFLPLVAPPGRLGPRRGLTGPQAR